MKHQQGPPYLAAKLSETTDKGRQRATQIMVAALEIFAADGYAGLSMRNLAKHLDLRLSTVQHYFPTKNQLLEAMLHHAYDVYVQSLQSVLDSQRHASPAKRFAAALDMYLRDTEDPFAYGIFFELCALANRDDFASEILSAILERARSGFSQMMRDLDAGLSERQCEMRARLIVAQIQGLAPFFGKRRISSQERAELKRQAHSLLMSMATEPSFTKTR